MKLLDKGKVLLLTFAQKKGQTIAKPLDITRFLRDFLKKEYIKKYARHTT